METTEKKDQDTLQDRAQVNADVNVARYDLLFITRAYNRKEISFDQWLKLTKEWAEDMIRQYGKAQ